MMSDNRDEPPENHRGRPGETTPDPSEGKPASQQNYAGSQPIEIKPAASGKFGVFHARQPCSPDPSSGLMLDANGEPVPIDKIIKTANTMSSMMMAHKIALEDDFRLEPGMDISGPLMSLSPIIGSSPSRTTSSSTTGQTSGPSLQSRVKDIVHEAYWDLFREELDSQTDEREEDRKYDLSKQFICDIRQKIIELLLPQHARLKQDLEDKLDPQIIDQLSKTNSLKLIDYAGYILNVLSKLCAPVRDEKLKELSETTDVVQIYRGIMELLELMRLDFANFTLNRFKPHIKAHSQDYEREKFNEILKQQQTIGIDGLEYTKIWLHRAIKRVDEVYGIADLVNDANGEIEQSNVGTSDDFSSLSKQDKVLRSDIINKVLNSAYCELLEWSSDKQKLYPETLLFDEATFKQLGEQYKVLLLTSSILLTTFAFAKSFRLQDNNEFKVLVKSHVITLLTASYDPQPPPTSASLNDQSSSGQSTSPEDLLDRLKLETIVSRICDDIRRKVQENDATLIESFENQRELLKRQITDIQSPSNRVRELTRRRILEFVDTLLALDIKHQQKKFSSKMPPPVNIPLGLNCLADEITLTMAQLVKIIRYNRRVFFQHYQNIIVELVLKII